MLKFTHNPHPSPPSKANRGGVFNTFNQLINKDMATTQELERLLIASERGEDGQIYTTLTEAGQVLFRQGLHNAPTNYTQYCEGVVKGVAVGLYGVPQQGGGFEWSVETPDSAEGLPVIKL